MESSIADPRIRKWRQAAFSYLHFGILYEAGAYAMYRQGLIPVNWGPPAIWVFVAGPLVALGVFFALLRWRNRWFAGVIWAVGAGRLPTLIHGAFVVADTGALAPSFYLTALVVSVINMWMLARAIWDL